MMQQDWMKLSIRYLPREIHIECSEQFKWNLFFLCVRVEPAILASAKTALKFKYEILIGLYVGAMSVINKIIPVSIALLKIIHSSLSGSCNSNCSSRSQFQNLLLRNANCGCCGKKGTLLLLRTFEVFELTFNNISIKRVFQKIWTKLG